MNNVIEIKNSEDWNTMSLLVGSISYYKENNRDGKYNNALDRESKQYKDYLSKYVRS